MEPDPIREVLMRWEEPEGAKAVDVMEEIQRVDEQHQQWLAATEELEHAFHKWNQNAND